MTWEELWYGPSGTPGRWWGRAALSPFSAVYRVAVGANDWAWKAGLRRPTRVPGLWIVSVGNLVVGGAGKTPVVIFLARWAQAAGRRVAVLSRGYGRSSKQVLSLNGQGLRSVSEVGDEPRLIARSCPGVEVWVGADRVELARRARAAGADYAILDDGFQHRRLVRDVDLVVVAPGSFGGLLPRGPQREPRRALSRADVLWLRDGAEVEHHCCVRARHFVAGVRSARGVDLAPERVRGVSVVLLTAVARPASVVAAAKALGLSVVARCLFPDHHRFTSAEIAHAGRLAQQQQAMLLTTEKDRERLPDDCEVWTLHLEVELTAGLDVLAERLGLERELAPRGVR